MFCVGDPLARVMTKKGLGGTRTWGRSQLVPEKEEEEEEAAMNKEEEEREWEEEEKVEEEGGTASSSMEDGQPGRQGGGLVDTLLPSSSLPTTSFPDSSCLYHPAKSHLMVKAPESRSPKYSCRKEPPEGFRFWLRRLC